jgi:phenylalanyl-tRNA synthetase alpha subunit
MVLMNVWFLLEKSRIDQQSLEEYYTKNPIHSLSEFIEKINDKLNKIGFSVKICYF